MRNFAAGLALIVVMALLVVAGGPGKTLWQIAARCYPGEHTGQMVAAIREANPGVDPGRLRVGQTLRLPVATEIAGVWSDDGNIQTRCYPD